MNYLLDTHTFLWFINDDPALSTTARSLIEDPDNSVLLSITSIWEMAIKVSLKKLEMPAPFEDFIRQEMHSNNFELLGLKLSHMSVVVKMPFHHRDPFDRLLIAQSMAENLPIIGRDIVFDSYEIERHW